MKDTKRVEAQENANYNRAIQIFDNIFKQKPIYKQMPMFHCSDMRMTYHTNKYNIELKSRGTSIYEYNEMPIKCKKYINLIKDTKDDETLLYIALVENGDYLIWNLSDIPICEMKLDNLRSKKEQYSIGYSPMVEEPYFFLTLDSACYKGHLDIN